MDNLQETEAGPVGRAPRFQFTIRSMLIVTAVVALLLGLVVVPLVRKAQRAAMKAACASNLKQIEVGLFHFDSKNGSLPAAYSVDATGRRMHSWRARIASDIDPNWEDGAYKWDEAWDGPNNSKLHNEPREIFSCPADPAHNSTRTSYVAVVGPETAWPGEKSKCSANFACGRSYCVTVVETANSGIHWMEPRDLEFDKIDFSINGQTKPGISSTHVGCANVGFADGAVRPLSDKVDPDFVKQLLSTDNILRNPIDVVPD
jgi:competence protein ComGC